LNADRAIILIPYGEDPLHRLTEIILDQHAPALPDLGHQVVLFSHRGAIARFYQILLEQARRRGYAALIPPHTNTLDGWLSGFSNPKTTPLSDAAREIVLHDTLADFPDLGKCFGTWPLIDSLLSLFDELTLHRCRLPANAEEFRQSLHAAYGANDTPYHSLDGEAQLVHSLWSAWQQHLAHHKSMLTIQVR